MRTRLSVLSASGAIGVLLVVVAAVAIGAEPVGNKADGATNAAVCAACHGPKGISVNPLWPSLAGQQEAYLAKQIKEFRDGVRVEATMQPFVANLTDQDVADLAAYYASLSPCP
ncbi:MAG: cytochrome c [Gammaproteobacteria bacterium]|nr:cytochrome c [Gammaproteobacteria bacterium]